MIFDFKSTKIALIMSMIFFLVVVTVLSNVEVETVMFVLVLVVFFFAYMTVLRRLTLKEISSLQRVLMIDKNPDAFREAYGKMLNKKIAFDKRWQITKYQNYILGSIFYGDVKSAEDYLEMVNDTYKPLIERYPVYQYLNHMIMAMNAVFYQTEDKDDAIARVEATYEKLNVRMKQDMAQNPNSFHKWLMNANELLKESKETVDASKVLEAQSEFNQVLTMFALKANNYPVDIALFNEKRGQLFEKAIPKEELLDKTE